MKKLISLLLAMVLTFSLTACSSAPTLLGKYEVNIDLTETIAAWFDEDYANQMIDAEALGISLANYMEPFEITVNMEFREDGTYRQTFDPASFEAAAEALKPALYAYAKDVSREQMLDIYNSLEEDLEVYLGSSWDEFYDTVQRARKEAFITDMLENYIYALTEDTVTAEGNFKAQNGKLYMSDLNEPINEEAYETYKVDGDTVTITGGVNMDGNDLHSYPYTMTKISE